MDSFELSWVASMLIAFIYCRFFLPYKGWGQVLAGTFLMTFLVWFVIVSIYMIYKWLLGLIS